MSNLLRTFRSASIATQTCSSVLAAVIVKRTAVDGYRRKQGGRDQDAVLPKNIAGLDDVGHGTDSYANERKQPVVIDDETCRALPRQGVGTGRASVAN